MRGCDSGSNPVVPDGETGWATYRISEQCSTSRGKGSERLERVNRPPRGRLDELRALAQFRVLLEWSGKGAYTDEDLDLHLPACILRGNLLRRNTGKPRPWIHGVFVLGLRTVCDDVDQPSFRHGVDD